MFLTFLVTLVVILVGFELFYNRKAKQFSRRTPGLPLMPFVGNAFQFKLTLDGVLNLVIRSAQCGKISRIQVGPEVAVVLTDLQDVQVVATHPQLQEKSILYNKLNAWLGEGLLISSGEKWRTRRRLLTPSFHFNILREFLPIFNRNSHILVSSFAKSAPNEPVDVFPMATLCALDILTESAMGVQLNAQLGHSQEYVKAVKEITHIVLNQIVGLKYKYEWIFKLLPTYNVYKKHLKTLHDFTRSVIKERREALNKDKRDRLESGGVGDDIGIKRRQSFLDTLISAGDCGVNLSDEDIREEVDTFMFEGHDTTASGMSFLLYSVANNPEVQEKLYQEQLEIFGDDLDRDITQEDLNNMKYAGMAIKESLRIFPSVPLVTRKCSEDFNLNGTEIPAGVTIGISIISINRNPEVFKDPLKFIPERFSPEEMLKRNPFSAIPFSAGKRNCIGQRFAVMELKCLLSKCVRHLVFSPGDEEPILGSDLVLKSLNGIKLRIRKR